MTQRFEMNELGSVYHLLWIDLNIFQKSYEKSAHALIAIQKCLTDQNLPDAQEQEFLTLYRLLADAEPHHFYQIWRTPFAQQWVKLAYRLCQACFADIPLDQNTQEKYKLMPMPALCRHLGEFKQIILAIVLLEKKTCHFENALRVKTPLVIPGSDFYFFSDADIDIIGLDQQGILIAQNDEKMPDILSFSHSKPCPRVAIDDYQLMLHAGVFNNFPGLDFAEPVINKPINYNADCLALVEKTLRIIQQYAPVIFQQFKKIIRFIGLKPLNESNYSNISYSELPGCFIASMVWNPYILADIFIHEFSHNRLFFIEAAEGHLFTDQFDALNECRFYSPWREELRPLYGVFHAVYVYIPVYHYWHNLYQDQTIDLKLKQFAENEMVKIAMQLKIGACQLANHGQFTVFGASLFKQLLREVEDIHQSIGQHCSAEIPAFSFTENGDFIPIRDKETEQPLSARAVISKHVQRFAPVGQSTEISMSP